MSLNADTEGGGGRMCTARILSVRGPAYVSAHIYLNGILSADTMPQFYSV